MPDIDRASLAIERFASRSRPMAHDAGVVSVSGHRHYGCRQSCPIAHCDGHAASVAFDKAGMVRIKESIEEDQLHAILEVAVGTLSNGWCLRLEPTL
jgi:hypothetical protein